MNKYMSSCPCIDQFITKLKTEDISYLYPCNWSMPCSFHFPCTRPSNQTDIEELKKEIDAIKKLNGFNINPLTRESSGNIIENTNYDNVVDEDIKNAIINLKTDLQTLNFKLNEIEKNVQHSGVSDAFCIVDKE
tara:strand:+ start:2307 stop:2708 length:402 start_codon:yes stop_codon:yes gene_type:complete